MHDQSVEELIHSFKRFIARGGRPEEVNASIFHAGDRRLQKVMEEEKIHDFLAQHHADWQFNPSRSP